MPSTFVHVSTRGVCYLAHFSDDSTRSCAADRTSCYGNLTSLRLPLWACSIDLHEYGFEFSSDFLRCTIVIYGQPHLCVQQRLRSSSLQKVERTTATSAIEAVSPVVTRLRVTNVIGYRATSGDRTASCSGSISAGVVSTGRFVAALPVMTASAAWVARSAPGFQPAAIG
jgi:hypothetical protein